MSKLRPEEQPVSGSRPLEQNGGSAREETWDPLASIRKTISPTQRIRLLKLEVPVLPPEDFMDTAELQRSLVPSPRRFLPLVVGLGAAFLILLVAGIWSRFLSTSSNEAQSTAAAPAAPDRPRLAASVGASPSLAAPPPARSTTTSPPSPTRTERLAEPRAATVSSTAKAASAKSTSAPKQSVVTPPIVPAVPEATAPSPDVAAPAPSGIKFWTQPR